MILNTENNRVNVEEFLEFNYLTYGNYINFNRVIPGIDGLKPVNRRILLALKDVANNKLVSTVNAIGATQKYHPFGEASTEGSIADMARIGAINSQGEFGTKLLENIPHAAPRYTKVGLTKDQYDFYFKLLKYCPTHEGEELIEPKFLLTPVPHALIYGSFSWGLGMTSRTPAFTYRSLVEAYYSNDYSKLESNYGYQLNVEQSELKELWEKGSGSITISYKVTRLNDNTILLSGSGEIFTPSIGTLDKYVKSGQVIIHNESDQNVVIKIAKVSNMRSVDMNEVFETCRRIAVKRRSYDIKVVYDGKIISLGLRDWLHITITKFTEHFEQSKLDRISENEFKIKVLTIMPLVAQKIIDNKPDSEIIKSTEGCTEEILSAIKKKSIGSLRRTDFESEIKSLKDLIELIKKEDAKESIINYCNIK